MRRSGIFLLGILLLCGSPSLAQFHQIPCPIPTNYINTSSSWDINTYQPCEIEVNGRFVNNGYFRNTGGGVLLNNGWIFSFGTYFDNLADGSIINNGTFYNSDSLLRNYGSFTNTAVMANYAGFINNGSLANTGNFDNLGTLLNSGTFDNQASLSSSGLIDNYGTLTNHNGEVLVNTNSIVVQSGGIVDNAGSITNSDHFSRFVVSQGGTFTNHDGGSFGQTGGDTQVSGILNSGTPLLFQSGLLQIMGGTVNGDVLVGGTNQLDSAGGLVNGSYTQGPDGRFIEVILSNSDYGHLAVHGNVTLDGTLEVDLPNMPALGDSFILLTFESLTGQFSALNLPPLGPGEQWALAYDPHDLTLSAVAAPVPEPSSIAMLLGAIGCCSATLRRRLKYHKGYPA